jgi:uncharacterized protein (TIGR00255 family)
MTGFARSESAVEDVRLIWELKSVNGKGLDIRFRLPGGFERVEQQGRKKVEAVLARGNLTAGLSYQREAPVNAHSINRDLLRDLWNTCNELATETGAEKPRLDVLAAVRGVVDTVDGGQEALAPGDHIIEAALAGLDIAVAELVDMREAEGAALATLIGDFIDNVAELTASARARADARPDMFLQRLRDGISRLAREDERFDTERLGQEALLLAAKADIREEMDRLDAHCAAARKLIAGGGPIGRKLDFLCQEFNREANTLCSKANDVELTNIGLELKSAIEQMREQVQNIE